MERKAVYHLLRLRQLRGENVDVEDWQVEDLRGLENEELFNRLAEFEIHLEPRSFIAFASESKDVESLTELLISEAHEEDFDQVFLLIFELWRRFCQERMTQDLICDEFDYLITSYDWDTGIYSEEQLIERLQDSWMLLLQILQEQQDQEGSGKEALALINKHCANDLESFLYDYLCACIDDEDYDYVQELTEAFLPYLENPTWFYILKTRISEVEEANEYLHRIYTDQKKSPNVDLLFDVLEHLCVCDIGEHFLSFFKLLHPLLEKGSEDERELLEFSRLYTEHHHSSAWLKLLRSLDPPFQKLAQEPV